MLTIDRTVVHYALHDPRGFRGGVETFARRLALVFREVLYMTPATRDEELVRARRLPVICDNHFVLDWPEDIPVIGFQHGVGFVKAFAVPSSFNLNLAVRQARAARRKNTIWVACARWVSDTFARLHGNAATKVLYYPVDLDEFDGRLDNQGSRLVLHDGRTPHKGSRLYPRLARAFPQFSFESLDCSPELVPARMRRAAAFLHLSRYEGNSVVCNEAMAMNLPCLFTRVGLFREDPDADVAVIPVTLAFGARSRFRRQALVRRVGSFLESLETRSYEPRRWVERNAALPAFRDGWSDALSRFDALPWA
jgi:hypothetical protein